MIIVSNTHHMKKVSEKNRAKIIKWFEKNPGETMKACHEKTGISYLTVRKHVKSILSEKEAE